MDNRMQEIRQRIEDLLAREATVLIAIDGNCTAGKTTLAGTLAEQYDCNVFHMDDYFLRPEQRTPERLAEAGGNVDYERFREEILLPLTEGRQVCYRRYDCHSRTLQEPVTVPRRRLNIVEGTYSRHPSFGDSYGLTVFLSVPADLQRQRIGLRPAGIQQRFFGEWIPMEQQYFRAFDVKETSDLVIDGIDLI